MLLGWLHRYGELHVCVIIVVYGARRPATRKTSPRTVTSLKNWDGVISAILLSVHMLIFIVI